MPLNPSGRRSMPSLLGMAGPKHVALGLLGLSVSAASIWLLYVATDISDLQQVLGGADWTFVGVATGTLALSMLVRAARWRVIFPSSPRGGPTAFTLLPVVLVGYAINAVVPMRLGDVVRGLVASRRFKTGTPETLGSVGLERILDAGALAVVAALASFGSGAPRWLTDGGLLIAVIASMAVVVIYVLEFGRRTATSVVPSIFWRTMAGLRASPRAIGLSIILSALAWAVDGVTVWIVAHALGIEMGWELSMLIATGAALGAILPSAPASIGTFHLAGTAVGVAMGVDAAAALSLVVVWHAMTFVTLLVAGGVSAMLIGVGRYDFPQVPDHADPVPTRTAPVPEATP